jgi:hypothetical protein
MFEREKVYRAAIKDFSLAKSIISDHSIFFIAYPMMIPLDHPNKN